MHETFTVDGNRLTLVREGQARLNALVELIDSAKESLRALYYVYLNDEAGQRVHAALLRAAARGAKVSLIVDGLGSDSVNQDAFFAPLRDAGIETCAFHPRWGRRYLLRNHQKMAIADGRRAIVGGFNISDDYFDEASETGWRDLGLRLDGPAAERLTGYYDVIQRWTQKPKSPMRTLRRLLRQWSNPAGKTRWLFGGPARRLSPWAKAVRADMKAARRLDMVVAYFVPTPGMLRRIAGIGRRGSARIVTAAKTDNLATIGAARFTYAGLLKKGVRLFEYRPRRLHTKLYVIDDAVYIGSANFDVRSLFLNLEIMLRIEDRVFADHVRAYIDGEIADSTEQALADYTGFASWGARLRYALCYFIVAVADYNVSRRLSFGVK